jgi:hypothetical protein
MAYLGKGKPQTQEGFSDFILNNRFTQIDADYFRGDSASAVPPKSV